MNKKYKLIILVTIILILLKSFQYLRTNTESKDLLTQKNNNANYIVEEKVKVSVYYEALCPDSKFFITFQLLPVYESLYENLIIDLVPYGKAKVDELLAFETPSLIVVIFLDDRKRW